VRARFRDDDAARERAHRLRNEEPLTVYWLRGRTLSAYATTADRARAVARVISAPSTVVRPLSRLRAWWMRQHVAGNHDSKHRFERRLIELEVRAAALADLAADAGTDSDTDLNPDLDFDVDLGG
jgi:hypothetical protein